MNQSNRRIEWIVWGAILLTILLIAVAFVRSQLERRYLIDLPIIAQIPDFTLTNQDGRAVSLADLRGSVWVGDIIFTRCAMICPAMTQRMSDLQKVLPAKDSVKLITLTTDPEFDRPKVLRRYGERFKANFDRWAFLGGAKSTIVRVAVDGLKLIDYDVKPEDRKDERDLFVHSILFVLVDKQGRLRGSVESNDPKMKQKVLAAVKQLLSEK